MQTRYRDEDSPDLYDQTEAVMDNSTSRASVTMKVTGESMTETVLR